MFDSPAIKYMNEHMEDIEFRGETQEFLPRPSFDIVTAESVIRHIVKQDGHLFLGEQEREALIKRIAKYGRKMFATCVYGGLPMTCLKALFDDGLDDGQFPFKLNDCPGQKDKQAFRVSFLKNQKLFNPAYLSMDSEQDWDIRITKPIEYNENKSSLLGQGAFGNVYRIYIHPEQRSFSSVCHLSCLIIVY
jgi:hypothetical protein